MKQLNSFLQLIMLLGFLAGCNGQSNTGNLNQQEIPSGRKKLVGGGCDGCELMYVGMPATIQAVDTSAGWTTNGQKLLIKGTVYKPDGNTPAPDVIIYYWQTDNNGYYSPVEGMDEKAKRHGYIRGWVKTDGKGTFSIYTIRPAPYPADEMPAHIHLAVKEPGIGNEYYLDDIVFDDDPLLTPAKRKKLENRGGSGIVKVADSGSLHIARHTIISGKNIPDYPEF